MSSKKGTFFMALGALLLAAALLLLLYNRWDAARADREASTGLQEVMDEIARYESAAETADSADGADGAQEEAETGGGDADSLAEKLAAEDYVGYLSIPALGLELPVMKTWSYPNLRTAPCRYYGSPEEENLVIIAHNYARHFGNISRLQNGDRLIFTDILGQNWFYTVGMVGTLEPSAVAEATDGSYALTLLTCTPGGAKRVTVRCTLETSPLG